MEQSGQTERTQAVKVGHPVLQIRVQSGIRIGKKEQDWCAQLEHLQSRYRQLRRRATEMGISYQ